MKIEQAIGDFAMQLEADGRSPHTRAQYERHIGGLMAWLEREGRDLEIGAVGHRDLAAFLASDIVKLRADGKPRKASSSNTIRSSLRVFFGYLHAAGELPCNPARLIRLAVCGPAPPRALSDGEQSRFLAALDTATTPAEKRDAVLFRLLLATGARLGAVLACEVGDFSASERELRLRKQKRGREAVVYLTEEVVAALAEHLDGRAEGWLFPGQLEGGALGHRQAARRFGAWLERAGIERGASPHALRHSFATSLYRETGDILLVKQALHHRSLHSLLAYASTDDRALRERFSPGWLVQNSKTSMATHSLKGSCGS